MATTKKRIDKRIEHLRRDRVLRGAIDQVADLEHSWNAKARPNHFKALVCARL